MIAEIVSYSLIFLVSAFSIPVGVGGGIIFVPVLQVIRGADPKTAAIEAQLYITMTTLAASTLLVRKLVRYVHSNSEAACPIDINRCLIITPGLLAGSCVGVILLQVLPQIATPLTLFFVTVFAGQSTFKKGVAMFRKETNAAREAETAREGSCSSSHAKNGVNRKVTPELQDVFGARRMEPERSSDSSVPAEAVVGLAPRASDASTGTTVSMQLRVRKVQWLLLVIIPVFIVSSLLVLIRSSVFSSSNRIEKCSPVYWVLVTLQTVVCLGIGLAVASRYSETRLCLLSMFCSVLSGLAGASGAVLLSPFLLARGMSPAVISSTVIIPILLMAITNTLQYSLAGLMPSEAVPYMPVPFLGAVLGLTCMDRVVKKFGRPSIIVFVLFSLIVVGGVSSLATGIYNAVSESHEDSNKFLEFRHFC